MNPRTVSQADDFLRSPAGAAWQARLTAGYFDAAARQQVLEEVRAALAAGPAELQDLVCGRLLGAASRDVAEPAGGPDDGAGDGVEERIITSYPYPVARPFSALTEKERAMEAFGCLLDTFESLVHFLATVAVSAYLRGGAAVPECNRHLLEKFLKGLWSTGDLYALLRDTIRLAGDCAGLLPYPELPAYLFTAKGKPTPSNQVLGAFVALRNRAWGHATGRDEAFYADILPANLARLKRELARAPWLASWELLRPITIDDGGRVTRADLLMGNWRKRGRPYDLALRAEDLECGGGPVRAEKSLLLVAPDRRQYLPLFPLSLFHFQLSAPGVFFLQRLEWQTARDARKLRRAGYVAYESELEDHEESPGDLAARLLEQEILRLEAGAAAAPAGPAAADPTPPADPDWELTEVRHEQAFHLRLFAGREAQLRAVADWIGGSAEGGYLLLLGPPGQGKSALMAELARREDERGDCLLHMVKTHRNPLKFVPSLLSQAAKRAGERFGAEAYRGDTDDLRNALVRALEALVRRKGRAVLVLDALDELDPGGERVEFLPPSLPAGVRAVLTCRPDIPLVQALRNRLRDLHERALPPLSEDDLLPILRRRLGPDVTPELERLLDWRGLFDRLHRNPLFLHRALDRVGKLLAEARAAGVPACIDLDALPATLDALFEDIYGEIAGRAAAGPRGPEGRQRALLLQFLCLAREPLGFEALAELLAAAGTPLPLEDCRDRVLEMSQYLLDAGGNRFKPWHQGLTDYVGSQVLGDAGRRQLEGVFCAWLQEPGTSRSRYALKHRIAHILAARQEEEAGALLLDWRYLEAKTEAGLVFDLAGDFTETVARMSSDHPQRRTLRLLEEALRSDIHFIARHPQALFQCLWNLGWWYDCPEAAKHYDPPQAGWPPEGPPWGRAASKLATFLETWRAAKERETPGFVWLRSLRPPAVPLGSARVAVFRGHTQGSSAAFSPDGRLIVSGSGDRTVRVWDARSGVELACLRGHERAVISVAFSPDGRRIVSGAYDDTVRVWDAQSGTQLVCLRGHEHWVNGVAFSPDGRRIASGSEDGTVRLWDAASGILFTCLLGHEGKVSAVTFTPDGRLIASASQDGTVRLWDAEHGTERACLRGHEKEVSSVAFAPDGRRLASGSHDGTVRVWDTRTGTEQTCLGGDLGKVCSVAFAPDGRRLVIGFLDAVRVWDFERDAEVDRLCGSQHGVYSVAVAPDGRRIVLGSGDGAVRVWEPDGAPEPARLRGHERIITCLAFSPDGQRVGSGAQDHVLRIWDVGSGLEQTFVHKHRARATSFAFAPDSQRVAVGSATLVHVWDLASRNLLLRLRGHEWRVGTVAFSSDGRRIVSGSNDRTVRV